MISTKQRLRPELKSLRQKLTPQEMARLSSHITQRAKEAVAWQDIESMHTYQPLPRHREVDTRPLITTLRLANPALRIAIWEELFGTYAAVWLSPDTNKSVPDKFQFDLIVVPLLGFNDDCHRIGFGGGFYDRFLAAQPRAITVGLCYENGHVAFHPESHDIPLDYIITEKNVYTRQSPPNTK